MVVYIRAQDRRENIHINTKNRKKLENFCRESIEKREKQKLKVKCLDENFAVFIFLSVERYTVYVGLLTCLVITSFNIVKYFVYSVN